MWEVGMNVFIYTKLEGYRPSPTGCEQEMVNHYGTVVSLLNDAYCEIRVTNKITGETLSGCFHKCELTNLGHREPTYRVGDMVRICDMSEDEKREYPGGWYLYMDEHIGKTARIARHVGSDDLYRLEDTSWIWHEVNLKPVSEFVGF